MNDKLNGIFMGWFKIGDGEKTLLKYDNITIDTHGNITGYGINAQGKTFTVAGKLNDDNTLVYDKTTEEYVVKHDGVLTDTTIAGAFWIEGTEVKGTYELSLAQ